MLNIHASQLCAESVYLYQKNDWKCYKINVYSVLYIFLKCIIKWLKSLNMNILVSSYLWPTLILASGRTVSELSTYDSFIYLKPKFMWYIVQSFLTIQYSSLARNASGGTVCRSRGKHMHHCTTARLPSQIWQNLLQTFCTSQCKAKKKGCLILKYPIKVFP